MRVKSVSGLLCLPLNIPFQTEKEKQNGSPLLTFSRASLGWEEWMPGRCGLLIISETGQALWEMGGLQASGCHTFK